MAIHTQCFHALDSRLYGEEQARMHSKCSWEKPDAGQMYDVLTATQLSRAVLICGAYPHWPVLMKQRSQMTACVRHAYTFDTY